MSAGERLGELIASMEATLLRSNAQFERTSRALDVAVQRLGELGDQAGLERVLAELMDGPVAPVLPMGVREAEGR